MDHALREIAARPGFRRLTAVRLAGQLGDGLFQAALFSAVFFDPQRATSAGEAAVAFTVLLLPYSLVGPFAGVLLDRWRRQRVLHHVNLVRAVLAAGVAGLLAAFGPRLWLVAVLALVTVGANRFVLSGLSAALPAVVDARRLVTANAVTTTLGGGAALAGGGLGFAVRDPLGGGHLGAARVMTGAVVAYAVAGLLARRLGADELGPHARPLTATRDALRQVAGGLVAGARHVRERGPAARGLAALTAHRFLYGLSTVATLLLYTEAGAIGKGLGGLAAVGAATAAGGLAAALVTPAVTRRTGTQAWVVVVLAAAAVVQLAGGLPYEHGPFLVAAALLAVTAQASKICVDTLVQESVDDAFRGRVFAFYDTLFNLSFLAAAAASAVVLPDHGRSPALVVAISLGYAATAAVYGLTSARRAGVEPPEPVVTRR